MLTVTEQAAGELRAIVDREKEAKRLSEGVGLRVLVQGGGCAGFQSRLAFDHPRPDDKVFPAGAIRLLVDPRSYLYLKGTEIDFIDDAAGRGFVFRNPNPTGSCGGCGHAYGG